ncbi:140aa long hypothetical protein [Pyrococcus horikoshii OT3]|uniref:Uncharacterized protein n=1 Tax=Pyrococcus horikoshii (strain ATCC 700860 / DSM 12428 / JCM 9974 / NBRC 100139 / OT-3) TaxID=70601 RepID=O58200_PYRHO|nr:140aa long hypothetical protein [Pyrococcus horikoshii OT3]
MAEIARIRAIFARALPTAFPIAIPLLPLYEEIAETVTSGRVVATLANTRAIKNSLTLKASAILVAASTNISLPLMRSRSPAENIRISSIVTPTLPPREDMPLILKIIHSPRSSRIFFISSSFFSFLSSSSISPPRVANNS